MKIQWTKLPYSFDPALLQQDIASIAEEEWVPHFNRGDYEGKWSSIALRSRNGRADDIVPMGAAAGFHDTPLMERCPHLRDAVDTFAFPMKAVRLLRLHAGSRVREHVDPDLGVDDGEIRLHVPITTNDKMEFIVAGRQLKLREGESWYIDFSQAHRLHNGGDADRVHLLIDGEMNDWAKSLLHRAASEIVTETFEPAGAMQFAKFSEVVYEDKGLQMDFLEATQQVELLEAVVSAGGSRGYVFDRADVESVYRSNMKVWNSRAGEL